MKGLRSNVRVPFVPACRLTSRPDNWLTQKVLDTMPNWTAFAIAVYNPRYVTPEKAMAMYLRPELGQNVRWVTKSIAEEIQFLYITRHKTLAAIADLYGLSTRTIHRILYDGEGTHFKNIEMV